MYRTFLILMSIMVPTAFANVISKKVIILGICGVLIYSSAGIHNAVRDKDYLLPKYSKKVMFILISIAIIMSLSDYIILFTAIVSIFLGLIYNTFSRFILFGDSTILAITHFALPSLSSSLLLDLPINFSLSLAGFMYIVSWFIISCKNLKDTTDDRKRGYKTLTTVSRGGRLMSIVLLLIGFSLMFFSYYLFQLSNIFLITFLAILVIQLIVIYCVLKNKNHSAVKISRLVMILFLLGIILDRASNIGVVIIPLLIFLSYIALLLMNSFDKEEYRGAAKSSMG